MPTPRRAPARPRTLRRAIRLARTAYLREETTSEHAETNAELGEVEGGAERRRSAGNTASGARGAPMASGGTVRAERRQESARESEGARTGWRREWRGRWRCPQRRGGVVAPASSACRPRGAVGLTRSGARGAAVSERARGGGGRGAVGLGWLRWLGRLVGAGPPVNSSPFLFFLKFFFQIPF
jgi:hypothetical protein